MFLSLILLFVLWITGLVTQEDEEGEEISMGGTVIPLLDDIYDCDSSDGWSNSPVLDTEQKVQGTGSLSGVVRNGNEIWMYTLPASLDITNTHLYTWFLSSVPQFLDTKADGGIRIRVMDSSGYWGEWFMGGSDTYGGGWQVLVCDTTASFGANSGTPDLSDIVTIGMNIHVPVLVANKTNTWFDAMRYGSGLQIINGTESVPASMEDFVTAEAISENRWGVVEKKAGVYLVSGKLVLGSTTSGSDVIFQDKAKVVVFNYNDNYKITDDLFELRVEGNSSGSTYVKLGDAYSVGGSLVVTDDFGLRAPSGYEFLCDMSNTNIDELKLYGFSTYRASQVLIGDSGKQLSGNIHMLGCRLSAIDRIHRNLSGTTFYGQDNQIPFATSTLYAMKIFDSYGYDYNQFQIIGGYGLSSNQSEIDAYDFRSILSSQDIEVAVSGQTWNMIDPIWGTSGSPLIDWTNSSGSVIQKTSITVTARDTDGNPIDGTVYCVDEETEDIDVLCTTSGSDGSVSGFVCTEQWYDETHHCERGPFTRRVWAYGKDPSQIPFDVSSAVVESLTLTDDTGVELTRSQAQAVSGVSVGYHTTPYSAQGKDWTWLIDCGGNSLVNVYSWLSDQYATDTSGSVVPWVETLKLERTRLLRRSGTFYTERVENHGVYLMNFTGDVDYMTADDGTLYYPPTNVDFTLTNLVIGSEIGIYTSGSMTEVYHLESSGSTATYNYDWTGDQNVYIVIHSVNYVPITISNITLGSTDQSIPISQQYDRNYKNP